MSATVYFAGGEDECMVSVGGGTPVTTAGFFRSSFSRCALQCTNSATIDVYWQNQIGFSATSFWVSARLHATAQPGGTAFSVWRLCDANGIERLQCRSGSGVFTIRKVNAAGTATTLFTTSSNTVFNTSGVDKIDLFVNYAVAGQLSFYLNNVLLGSFSGDITTDSVTSLSYVRLAQTNHDGSGSANWSEVIVLDSDTRSLGLQTFQPVANGNTHNFDTGTPAASNVNEITLDDSAYDGSTTAAQIDQYTIPALVSGYGVLAFGVSARMAKGASGPTKMDLGVRTGGTDYWSADQVLGVSLLNYQNWWLNNPNTAAPWLVIPDNIGLKSVA